MIGVNNNKL